MGLDDPLFSGDRPMGTQCSWGSRMLWQSIPLGALRESFKPNSSEAKASSHYASLFVHILHKGRQSVKESWGVNQREALGGTYSAALGPSAHYALPQGTLNSELPAGGTPGTGSMSPGPLGLGLLD